MLKILQARLQQYVNHELPDIQLDLEEAEEPEIKLPTSVGSSDICIHIVDSLCCTVETNTIIKQLCAVLCLVAQLCLTLCKPMDIWGKKVNDIKLDF